MTKDKNIARKKEIAIWLREIRNNSGLTQEKFSEILELSVSAYKKIESGENQISIDGVKKIVEKLDVSADYILLGKRGDVDEIWKSILNCTEHDKIFMLLRLLNYFTNIRSGQYLTKEQQAMCDEQLLPIIKEMEV